MTATATNTWPATLQLVSSRVLLDGALRLAVLTLRSGVVETVELWHDAKGPVPHPNEPDAVLLDLGDTPVCPAPLDLHLHGAGGFGVPPADAAGELELAVERTLDEAGWSRPETPVPYSFLLALPVPQRSPADPVDQVAQASAAAWRADSRCVGLRLEGIFVSPSRPGVWPPEGFCAPDTGLLEQLVAAGVDGGVPVRVVDVAPELPGAIELIVRARELGLVVSLGHSDATFEQARRGIDAGATLATHTFNAMRPLHHRDPGIVAAVLSDVRVACELVCDGHHLHPGAIALAAAACVPAGRLVAVSDASPLAGCGDGSYEWAGSTVSAKGGRLVDAQGRLAGSARLLDAAPATLAMAGLRPVDALVAMSAAPLRVLEPRRPLGLVPGDRIWAVGPGVEAALEPTA